MNLIRSVLHMLWMVVTVIPWATAVVILSPLVGSTRLRQAYLPALDRQ